MPQLGNHVETSDSKQVADCGNGVATIQYFDFPFLQVPLAKLQEDEILQVALAENTQTPILQVPLEKLEKIRPKMGDDFTYSNNPDSVWKIEK